MQCISLIKSTTSNKFSFAIINKTTSHTLIMTSGGQNKKKIPHLALLPSAGMGHLAPFSRLAAALSARGCTVSFITAHPTVSSAESLNLSHLLASFPAIRPLHLPLAQLDPSAFPADADPFYLRYEAIIRSAHLLPPLLSSSAVSALVVDMGLASAFVPLANALSLPCFVFFTTSAAMLSLYAYFPTYFDASDGTISDIDVPGLWTVPRASIVPGLHDPNHFFTHQFLANSRSFPRADGILINTFEAMEGETLAALNASRVTPDLPPVLPIGPLRPIGLNPRPVLLPWLDAQPDKSVVYVSFGSRTAMRAEQIKQLGAGLERSQCRFLWVIKTKKVDKEEEETNLEELLGEGYAARVKERGMVVNGWVEQEEILRHRAVGGFVSHCGWNSVTEAAMAGVRVLAWPRGADQRVNGEVVRRSRVGVWMEEWWWEAEEGVVSGEEIGRRVREMMEDEELRRSAERMREESRKAVDVGGSSDEVWKQFIGKFLKCED